MSVRTALIAALCMVFLVTRGVGVHLHWSHGHGEESVSGEHAHAHEHSAHVEPVAYVAAEFNAGHLDSHLAHGDIDVDSATAAEKVPLLKFYAALLAFIGALLFLIPSRPLQIVLPPQRPPRRRPGLYLLLPPSQAPPCAA